MLESKLQDYKFILPGLLILVLMITWSCSKETETKELCHSVPTSEILLTDSDKLLYFSPIQDTMIFEDSLNNMELLIKSEMYQEKFDNKCADMLVENYGCWYHSDLSPNLFSFILTRFYHYNLLQPSELVFIFRWGACNKFVYNCGDVNFLDSSSAFNDTIILNNRMFTNIFELESQSSSIKKVFYSKSTGLVGFSIQKGNRLELWSKVN